MTEVRYYEHRRQDMIINADKENAKKVLGEVLDALHEKEYENICSVVDEVDLEELRDVLECIEMMIDPDNIDRMDNEDWMEIYEFEDGMGFGIDYQLTCCGDSIGGITLVMDFLYEEGKLKSILRTIDAI